MSKDYPNRADWLAKRCTPRGQKHQRLVSTGGTFRHRRPGPTHIGKSGVRADRKMRKEAMYRSFFADPNLIARADNLGLMHLLPDHQRLVRDTVLGTR